MLRLAASCAAFLTAALAAGQEPDDLDSLLAGVREVARPGVPGPVAVVGPRAFPVVTGVTGSGARLPVVAAARWREGRVVAFGHGGYFGRGALESGQTARLVLNAARWAAGRQEGFRIGCRQAGDLPGLFREQGLPVLELERLDEAVPEGTDLLCLTAPVLDGPDAIEQVRGFIAGGGGVLIAGLGWGWQQVHSGQDLRTDHPGNRLLRPAGLVWGQGYLDRIEVVRGAVLMTSSAWQGLEALENGPGDPPQVAGALVHAVRALPPDEDPFLARLRRALDRRDPPIPSAQHPVDLADAAGRVALVLQHLEDEQALPGEVLPASSAGAFPGAVPPGAPREARELTLDLSVDGWAGTGLYAAPGEVVTFGLPDEAAGLGVVARIGAHSDTLWHLESWQRHPEICRRFPLAAGSVPAASPHGGLIYLEVPPGLEGQADVSVEGAVAAPRFVLDTTDPGDWRRRIRGLPAPWAELETRKVVLTVPSSAVRNLDDPAALMRLWDRVLDCYAELGQRPLARRPQRMVCDQQISAGYMHAGYPIMMHLDVAGVVTDPEKLIGQGHGGVWGLWHELGHNHQQPEWTFGGTGEVTCNLFSLFVIQRISGVAPADTQQIRNTRTRALEYLEAPDFGQWKRDPFLALYQYAQVQDAFGWEVFQQVFAEYRGLPAAKRPRGDDEKRDQWLTRLSRACGRDLGPFFQAWGVPTSQAARASLADLEPWLPAGIAGARR